MGLVIDWVIIECIDVEEMSAFWWRSAFEGWVIPGG